MRAVNLGLLALLLSGGACGDTKKEKTIEKVAGKPGHPVDARDEPDGPPTLPVRGVWRTLGHWTYDKILREVVTEDGFFQWENWSYGHPDYPYEESLNYFSFKDESYYALFLPAEMGKIFNTGDETAGLSFVNNTVHIHNIFVSRTGKPEDGALRDVLLNLDGMKWTILDEPTKRPEEAEPKLHPVKIPDVDPRFPKLCKENPLETDRYLFFDCPPPGCNRMSCLFQSSMYDKIDKKWYQMGTIDIAYYFGHRRKWKNNILYMWGGSIGNNAGGVYRFDPNP